ncbi:sestrin-2 [Procambarus clarkii]|uniref:sestrin-2 n=1 Tax=Procambarus clarkii TaxID=6728 RepID=UPI001E67887E|nr:sestrin-2-like [Procambarus clarkii]
MGHLVEQSEVAAIETQVSKATPTTAVTVGAQQAQHAQLSQAQQGHLHMPQQHQHNQQQQQQQQHGQGGRVLGQGKQGPRQQLHHPLQTKQSDLQQRREEGEEKSEDEGSEEEEEENGWWAEKVVGVLGGLGDYGDTWYRSHAHLLHGDGPLPHTWRLYIAALAMCRHEVEWLMKALLTDFSNAGGDIRWIAGLHHAPPKLYALVPINNLLAHRPWLLMPKHIQELTKGEESWSLGELCQALCIMTHFHALATFLHGCGLSKIPRSSKKDEGQADDRDKASNGKPVIGGLQNRQGCPETSNNTNVNINGKLNARSEAKKSTTVDGIRHGVRAYAHLTVNPTLAYEDFNGNDESRIPSFSVHEYNWQDHGYAMCSRLLGEVGAFLDERFTSALSPTYSLPQKQLSATGTVSQQTNSASGQAQCDKTLSKSMPLPTKALWNYVQWLLGIHHDDCNYAELNKHLDPQVKAFVKAACCYPESLGDTSSNTVSTNSINFKAVETSVVVMEARLQSELLYALRAIMLHQC